MEETLRKEAELGRSLAHNKLDLACRDHDISYGKSDQVSERHKADKILEKAAWSRVKAKDSSLGEKIAGVAVTGLIKAKRKLGMGVKNKNRVRRRKGRNVTIPSKLKMGGFLPLLPLFAGLSALGSLATGASSIATSVNRSKADKQKLEEQKRHNKMVEILGKGLYLKPYAKGSGIKKKNFRRKKR